MDTFPKTLRHRLFRFHAEDVFDTRADKCVAALCIQHKDDVWEAIYKSTSEFLLLMQTALNFPSCSHIHQCALVADDFASVVPHRSRSVEAGDGLSILADQNDFAAFDD